MNSYRDLYEQYFYYILVADLVIGLLLGLIPFFLARSRGNVKFGLLALIVSGLVGMVSPVLSIVAAIILSVIAVRQGPSVTAAHDPGNPADK